MRAYLESEIGREIVVRLGRLVGKGIAILEMEAQTEVVAAACEVALVGNISPADDEGSVHRNAVEVVVEVMVRAHPPCIAVDYAVESPHRIEDSGGKLMPEARPSDLAVVEGKG